MADVAADDVAVELTKITLQASDCPVDTVTVFNDRAEVTRIISHTFDAAGAYELEVEDLPRCINSDSVRVTGSGHVVLNEVSFGVRHKPVVAATDGTASAADALRATIERLEGEIVRLEVQKEEIQGSVRLLNRYADTMLKSPPSFKSQQGSGAGNGAGAGATDPAETARVLTASMDAAFTLLDTQQAKLKDFNTAIAALDDQISTKRGEKDVAMAKLRSRLQGRPQTRESRDVTVVLDATRAGGVELKLIYMVSRASWKPAYDLRITSTEAVLALTYYGVITQTTGEDWKNAKLVLSTATPSVGGSAPVLPTKHIRFPLQLHIQAQSESLSIGRPRRYKAARLQRSISLEEDDEMDIDEAKTTPRAQVATATVEEGGAATTFHIQRRGNVESDNKPHKVTVMMTDLESTFRYYAAPAVNPKAYLQCLTTNTTDFTLLPTSQVNVFLDGSFVSKTDLKLVSPGEKFRTFLGADAGVKVEYRPVSSVHDESGYFSKKERTRYKFVTSVKNTKPMPIRVVIADMLPVSDDHSVKVKLVEPSQEAVDAGSAKEAARRSSGSGTGDQGVGDSLEDGVALVKDTHNLVWTRNIAPGASVSVPYEYVVEHPSGRPVVVYNA